MVNCARVVITFHWQHVNMQRLHYVITFVAVALVKIALIVGYLSVMYIVLYWKCFTEQFVWARNRQTHPLLRTWVSKTFPTLWLTGSSGTVALKNTEKKDSRSWKSCCLIAVTDQRWLVLLLILIIPELIGIKFSGQRMNGTMDGSACIILTGFNPSPLVFYSTA